MNLVRPFAKAAGKVETRDAIVQHYVQLGEIEEVALTSQAR